MTSIDFQKMLREEKKKYEQSKKQALKKEVIDNANNNDNKNNNISSSSEKKDSVSILHSPSIPPFILEKMDPLDLQKFKVGFIPTVYYIPSFISKLEHDILVSHIYAQPPSRWTLLKRRRLQNWGGIPSIDGMIQEELADWLKVINNRLVECGVFNELPNHALLNEYCRGQGIMRHKDGPLYFPCVAILSLGTTCFLQFSEKLKGSPIQSVLLHPQSLLIFTDDAYTQYFHGIEETTTDLVDKTCVNCDEYPMGFGIERETRLSLTIRIVLKLRSADSVIDNDVTKADMKRNENFFYSSINEGDRV